ncbi:energy transducer TonB [Nannocystaceae bacterium ST9]
MSAEFQRDLDEPSWCVEIASGGCSLGEREATAMPASERRAIRLTRAHGRAQALLAQTDEQPRERRAATLILIGLSVGLHALGFAALAWFGTGIESETRVARRGREPFTDERVIVPVEFDRPEPSEPLASEQPSTLAPEPAPTPTRTRTRERAEVEPAPSEPASYSLPGFTLSSEGALPAGSGEGEAWGERGGRGHGHAAQGGTPQPEPAGSAPTAEVQAKPRGSVVEPDYPPELERRGIEGDAVVLVWLDEHGHVIKAEVAESSGYEAFDHNAMMAAQQQGWTPAMRGGEAIASKRRYRIRFKLPSR